MSLSTISADDYLLVLSRGEVPSVRHDAPRRKAIPDGSESRATIILIFVEIGILLPVQEFLVAHVLEREWPVFGLDTKVDEDSGLLHQNVNAHKLLTFTCFGELDVHVTDVRDIEGRRPLVVDARITKRQLR